MTDGKRNIIRQLLEEYDIETAEDIQDALKDLLGGIIKEIGIGARSTENWVLCTKDAYLNNQKTA